MLDFEQWLYANKDLEKYLSADDYLDLISLNYKKNGVKYDLWKLLTQHIDLGEFEAYKMLGLLKDAQQKTDQLPYILIRFYDLYCKGYGFLEDLGIGFGLAVRSPRGKYSVAYSWSDLSVDQQKEVIDSFSPQLEASIERVINWIETKKIVLTGKQDGLGLYEYEDFRTPEERESQLFIRATEADIKASTSLGVTSLDNHKSKKWWQFWK